MNAKEKTFISAVVYVRNNENEVEKFLELLDGELKDRFENYEIIFADDRSTDSTVERIRKHSSEGGAVSVVRMSYPQGVQLAMNAGVDLAIGDFVYEFESCRSDFPKELVFGAYERALSGFDVVSVSPKSKRKLSSRLFYSVYNRYSSSMYPLETVSFRLASRRAINRISQMGDVITYRKAFYMNCGLKCDTVEYEDSERTRAYGENRRERRELAADSLILFTDVSYRLSLFMSVLMMSFAVFSGLYTVIVFALGKPIEGWTTMMLLMSFAFFGVFAMLTIVVKYLSVAINLIFKKQRYSIESVEKL